MRLVLLIGTGYPVLNFTGTDFFRKQVPSLGTQLRTQFLVPVSEPGYEYPVLQLVPEPEIWFWNQGSINKNLVTNSTTWDK